MSNTNLESWYYTHRSTAPSTFYECEDLLNTVTIYIRDIKHVMNTTISSVNYSFISVPLLNYVIICSTKIYTSSSGTYTIKIISSTNAPITLYLLQEVSNTSNLTSYTITGSANAVRTQTLSLNINVKYTLCFVQSNTTSNNSLFVQTTYSGVRSPVNNAYTGGTAITSFSTSSSTVVAIGDYKWSSRPADFDGWLLCDGRAVFRDAYPQLFSIIGTKFGSGNGTTTFNIPDSRGRVCGGIGQGSGLTSRSLGDSIGEENHSLTTGEMPVHSHNATSDGAGSHSHTYQDAYFAEVGGVGGGGIFGTSAATDGDNNFRWRTAAGGWSTTASDINTNIVSSHTHIINVANTGSGGSHNNIQPTVFIGNLFICAEI